MDTKEYVPVRVAPRQQSISPMPRPLNGVPNRPKPAPRAWEDCFIDYLLRGRQNRSTYLTIVIKFDDEQPLELYGCEQFFIADIAAGHNQERPETVGEELHVKQTDLGSFATFIADFVAGNVEQLIVYFENNFQDKLPSIGHLCSMLSAFTRLQRLSLWIDPGFDGAETFFGPLCAAINSLLTLTRLDLNLRNSAHHSEVSYTLPLQATLPRLVWFTAGCFIDNLPELLEVSSGRLRHLSVTLDGEKFEELRRWTKDNAEKVGEITQLEMKLHSNEVDDFALQELCNRFGALQQFRFEDFTGQRCAHTFAYTFNSTNPATRRPREVTLIGVNMLCQHRSQCAAKSVLGLTIVAPANTEFSSLLTSAADSTSPSASDASQLFWYNLFSVFPAVKSVTIIGHCKEPKRVKYNLEMQFRLFFRHYERLSYQKPQLSIELAEYKCAIFGGLLE